MNKNIILGITGSVATIKAPLIAGALIKSGFEVAIVATNPALYFLPTESYSFENSYLLTDDNKKVNIYRDKDEWPSGGYHRNDTVKHIEFRKWADILLIAPITANTLAKITVGISDNFLCCIARAWQKEKPFVLAPAMNTEMWIDPITKQHILELNKRFLNMLVLDPVEKRLACGDIGNGAMTDINSIVEGINKLK